MRNYWSPRTNTIGLALIGKEMIHAKKFYTIDSTMASKKGRGDSDTKKKAPSPQCSDKTENGNAYAATSIPSVLANFLERHRHKRRIQGRCFRCCLGRLEGLQRKAWYHCFGRTRSSDFRDELFVIINVVFLATRFGLKCVTTDAVDGLLNVVSRGDLLDVVQLAVLAGDIQVSCAVRVDRLIAFIAPARDFWMPIVESRCRLVVSNSCHIADFGRVEGPATVLGVFASRSFPSGTLSNIKMTTFRFVMSPTGTAHWSRQWSGYGLLGTGEWPFDEPCSHTAGRS